MIEIFFFKFYFALIDFFNIIFFSQVRQKSIANLFKYILILKYIIFFFKIQLNTLSRQKKLEYGFEIFNNEQKKRQEESVKIKQEEQLKKQQLEQQLLQKKQDEQDIENQRLEQQIKEKQLQLQLIREKQQQLQQEKEKYLQQQEENKQLQLQQENDKQKELEKSESGKLQKVQKKVISNYVKEKDLQQTDKKSDQQLPALQQQTINPSNATQQKNQQSNKPNTETIDEQWNESPAYRTKLQKYDYDPQSQTCNYYITMQTDVLRSAQTDRQINSRERSNRNSSRRSAVTSRDRSSRKNDNGNDEYGYDQYDDDKQKQYPVSAKSKLSSRDSYRPVMKKYFDLIDNSKYSKDQLDKSQTPESKSRKQQIQSRSAGIDRPLRKSTSKGRKRQESGKDYNNYDDEYQRIDSQYSKERPRQSATREFIITVENSQQTKKLPQSDKKKDLVNNSAEIDDIETLIPQIVRDVYPIGANKNDGEKNLNKLEEVIQEISKLSGGVGIKNNQSKQITKEQCLKGGILYVEPNTEAHKKLSEYYSQAARKLTALWSVLFVPDSQKQEYRQFVQSPQPRSQMTLFNYQLIFNKVESYLPAYELKKQLARNIAIRQYYVDNFLSLNKAGSPFKDLQSLIDNINQYTDICKQGFKQWLCALPWNTTSFLRQRDEFAELMESERTVQNLIDRAKKQTDEK